MVSIGINCFDTRDLVENEIKTLRNSKKALPYNHQLDLATLYFHFAMLIQNSENRKGSFKYFMKCKKIRKELLASNHPDLAEIYNKLAIFLQMEVTEVLFKM